jgi:C2H2-type zinc finger
MARREENEGKEKKIKVDGIEVKVKTPPPRKVRPVYYCQTCDKSFPSQLDLAEHKKIDHNISKKGR